MENFIDKPSQAQDESLVKNKSHQEAMVHIRGWGVDIDPKNDPTYPMRQRLNESTKNDDWERGSQQTGNTEVLQSIERPHLTTVYGTSTPPSGLSGMIRRFAFKLSEGKMGHWLALLLADRVNVVEGLVTDIKSGHMPNVFAESGMKAQWKHNPKAVVTKAVIGVAIVTTIALLISRKRNSEMNTLNDDV